MLFLQHIMLPYGLAAPCRPGAHRAQAAICTVRAYPYAADLPAIVEEVATERGERCAANLLASCD